MSVKNDIIDTGLVEFELSFDRGTEKIYFNPNDVDFYIRLTDMINSTSEIYESMSKEYEKAEEAQDNREKIEILRRLNEKVRNNFDIAFGNNVSDGIFKYVSPHGIIKSKNQYYVFYILDWLMPKIAEETGKTSNEAVNALQKAMNRHTVKYAHKFN